MKNKLMSIFLIVTVLMGIMLTTASAAQEEIYVGGVKMTKDTYLANGALELTTEKPTDKGYAHLTEGVNGHVLTLHDYEYTGVGHKWSTSG